jgi:hypothetical protein
LILWEPSRQNYLQRYREHLVLIGARVMKKPRGWAGSMASLPSTACSFSYCCSLESTLAARNYQLSVDSIFACSGVGHTAKYIYLDGPQRDAEEELHSFVDALLLPLDVYLLLDSW